MQFVAEADGTPTKSGVGMYSKEEEYVPFCQPCDCTGQVKLQMQLLMFHVQNSVGTWPGSANIHYAH